MAKSKYDKPLFTRAREALGVLRGTHRPPYRLDDLARLVKYVVNVEKIKRDQRLGYRNDYRAGNEGRLREDWTVQIDTPTTELRSKQIKIVARSRDLFKNDDTYRNAINTIINNTIGIGLWPKPKIKNPDGTLNKALNKKIERLFWIYSNPEEWDARQKMPFIGEGQRMALKGILMCGDNFFNAVASQRNNSLLPVCWQMFEIDRLDASRDTYVSNMGAPFMENIKRTVHGINVGEYGNAVSYNIVGLDKPIPARNIIHSYMTDRPEQYIGIPAAVAGINSIYDSHELLEDYVLKSRAIAKLLWFLSDQNADVPYSDDEDSDSILGLDTMSQMRGKEAPADIKFPDNVNDTIAPLVRLLKHGVCSGLGTSYTAVTKDMENVNFAASKFIDIQDWRFYTTLRDWFNYETNRPFYNNFLQMIIVKKMLPEISIADYVRYPFNYTECEWVGNGKMDVDPLKDITADIEGLKNGIYSINDVVLKRGKDRDDHLDELEADKKDLELRGLPIVYGVSETAQKLNTEPVQEEGVTK